MISTIYLVKIQKPVTYVYVQCTLPIFYSQVYSKIKSMASNKSAYCLQDIEDEAVKILPRNALGYYQSGADKMVTLRANRSAFLK